MMVEINPDPNAGGNRIQPDDGRDEFGRLPEPLDAAHFGHPDPDVDVILLPGMPPSQPAGTGPVVSTPTDPAEVGAVDVAESAAAQGTGEPPSNDPAQSGLNTGSGLLGGKPPAEGDSGKTPPAKKSTPPAKSADSK